MKSQPLQKLTQDIVDIVASPKHNPHQGSLHTNDIKRLLKDEHPAFFDDRELTKFHGFLTVQTRLTLFQHRPKEGQCEWRVRLPDNADWQRNDNKMRQARLKERTEWPFKIAKIVQAEGGQCALSKVLKLAKKAKLNHPKPPVMLRVLKKEPWVTLVGTEGEKCDWTLILNKTELPRKRIRRGGSKETRKLKKKSRPKKKKAPAADVPSGTVDAAPAAKTKGSKGGKRSKKKGSAAKKAAPAVKNVKTKSKKSPKQ
mmetsp:Transcript_110901/g.192228  ORF Transcript_110901/g.192228 Transcript_110901/m.192228 type:complete len:256 (-) Transcript_110901:32-799(-)